MKTDFKALTWIITPVSSGGATVQSTSLNGGYKLHIRLWDFFSSGAVYFKAVLWPFIG